MVHGMAMELAQGIPILENQGHKAIAIDLPGMGRDKTPINQIKMKTTVEIICKFIDSIDGKVILVGHSKNGIMISKAAEYRPAKIEKLLQVNQQ
ncbi:MAG: alpha/beta fold hydrolase [Ginsengibacter sp.]